MAVLVVVLLAAVQLALAGESARLVVVSAPGSVRFDAQAGAIPASDVTGVLSNAMGFQTAMSWNGLYSGNVFSRPAAALSIFFDGYADALPMDGASFPISGVSSLNEILSPQGTGSVASVVSESTGQDSFTLSMSADHHFAAEGSSRDVGASHDLSVSYVPAQGFVGAGKTFVAEAELNALFAQNVLGSDVVFDAGSKAFTVTVNGQAITVPLTNSATLNLFAELHAMVAVLTQTVASARTPAVFTFTVSTLRGVQVDQRALAVLLSRFVAKMTTVMQSTFVNNFVSIAIFSAAEARHHLAARSVAAPVTASAAATAYVPSQTPRSKDFIDYCASYTCYCNKDANGTAYPVTGDSTCSANNRADCPFLPCACTSPYVQAGSAKCKACQTGFYMQNGECYVASNYPGMFQIWFWGGLALALALISTCYAIGNMDPGTNGVIYRMTQQRLKSN